MIAKLINLEDSGAHSIPLEHVPVVLGSAEEAGIMLADQRVCGLHCMIDEVDGDLMIYDLASDTGTYVNSAQVTESVLHSGDILRLGSLDFVVSYDRPTKRSA